MVQGKTAFVGHIDPPHGTSIVDVLEPSHPRLLSTLEVPPETHSHKVRVSGDIMVINNENYTRHQQIGGSRIPAERIEPIAWSRARRFQQARAAVRQLPVQRLACKVSAHDGHCETARRYRTRT